METHTKIALPYGWKYDGPTKLLDDKGESLGYILEKGEPEGNGHRFRCIVPGCPYERIFVPGQNITQFRKMGAHHHPLAESAIQSQLSRDATVQSRTAVTSNRVFEGTIEKKTINPDGSEIYERRVGTETTHEQSVTEMQAKISTLEHTIANQQAEQLAMETDTEQRFASLRAVQPVLDASRLRGQRDRALASSAQITEGALPMDIYLMSQVILRQKDKLASGQHSR